MPREYRGRLSRACETCRTRKIKCSETRPICKRCGTYKLDCQYRDLGNLWFRDESKTTASKVKHSIQLKSNKSQRTDYEEPPPPSDGLKYTPTAGGPVLSFEPLRLDHAVLARARFIFDYTLPPRDGVGNDGMLDFLPVLLMRTRRGSALDETISAVSLANFCRRTPGCDSALIRSQAFDHCQLALKQIKRSVENVGAGCGNELLLAVFLLGIFETMSTGGGGYEFWDAHARGLAALLAARLPSLASSDDETDGRIFCGLSFQMLFTCLRLKRTSYLAYDLVKPLYEADKSGTFRLLRYMHEAVDLLGQWNELQSKANCLSYDPSALFNALSSVEKDLIQWTDQLKLVESVDPTTCALSNQPIWVQRLFVHPGSPAIIEKYRDMQSAIHLNLVRVVLLLIGQVHLQAASSCLLYIPEYIVLTERRQRMTALAEGICRSVFAHLTVPIAGKSTSTATSGIVALRAYFLMNPLNAALLCARKGVFGSISEARADWINSLFKFIDLHIHNKG